MTTIARRSPRFFPSHLFKSSPPASQASGLQHAPSPRPISRVCLSRTTAFKADSELMSKMTCEEKKITGQDNPVKGGPTAPAQKHANQPLTSDVIHDITKGEEKITGNPNPKPAGPTSTAQSILTKVRSQSILTKTGNAKSISKSSSNQQGNHSGVLDSSTISKITEAEKKITGNDQPAPGGPTARAQQHAGEPISSQALHDITEGEKQVSGGERVKGGPTSTAQSELGKSRS